MKFFIKNIFILLAIIIPIFLIGINKTNATSNKSDVEVNLEVACEKSEIFDIDVSHMTKNSAKINWKTDNGALCQLLYGISTNYGDSRIEQNYLNKNHFFNITSLVSGATYHYKIVCQSICAGVSESKDQTFNTEKNKGILPGSNSLNGGSTPFAAGILNFFGEISISPVSDVLYIPVFVAACIVNLISLTVPVVMNLPVLSFWSYLYVLFFGFIKKKDQGKVYESESGISVPMAEVRVFDYAKNELLTKEYTNKNGSFSLPTKPGKYYLEISKNNYTFPSRMTNEFYHKEIITIKKGSNSYIKVPLDPDMYELGHKLGLLSAVLKYTSYVRIPVLIIGIIIAFSFYFYDPTPNDLILLGAYMIFWIYELYLLTKVNHHGKVIDTDTHEPVEHGIVRLYDKKTGHLKTTEISGGNGKYSYLTSHGEYKLKAVKQNFKPAEIPDVQLHHGKFFEHDIYIKKDK